VPFEGKSGLKRLKLYEKRYNRAVFSEKASHKGANDARKAEFFVLLCLRLMSYSVLFVLFVLFVVIFLFVFEPLVRLVVKLKLKIATITGCVICPFC
jgi:hypothetical protein